MNVKAREVNFVQGNDICFRMFQMIQRCDNVNKLRMILSVKTKNDLHIYIAFSLSSRLISIFLLYFIC